MTDNNAHISFEDPEHPVSKAQQPAASVDLVSDGYFHAMEIPLAAGRDFTVADSEESTQVMIVNQAFAQKFFPGENVLGKKLRQPAAPRRRRRVHAHRPTPERTQGGRHSPTNPSPSR